jgi:hypothetical protein
MTRYLLSVHTVEDEAREPMTDEEMQQSLKQLGALEGEMKSTGAWVYSARLHGPESATVVWVSGGRILTTDGPFAETKEHLGGFYIIELRNLTPRSPGRRGSPKRFKRPSRFVPAPISQMSPGVSAQNLRMLTSAG